MTRKGYRGIASVAPRLCIRVLALLCVLLFADIFTVPLTSVSSLFESVPKAVSAAELSLPPPDAGGLLPSLSRLIDLNDDHRPSPKVKVGKKPEKVTIVIKVPADNDQLAYMTNMLFIPLLAEVKPSKYASSVKWYIDKNGNTALDKGGKVTPGHNPAGAADYFDFTSYPENNSDFGKKTIMAEIPGKAVATPVTIEVFFDPLNDSHPPGQGENGKTPNWFYYWGQTSAGSGFSPVFLQSHPCGMAATGTYWFNKDYIALYPATYDSVCMNRADNSTAKGIDCYAETLRHENVHREELNYWWRNIPNSAGVDMGAVSSTESPLLYYLSSIGPVECDESLGPMIQKTIYNWFLGVDSDADLVPDYIENGLAGCRSDNPISCPKIPMQVVIKAQAVGKKKLDVDMNSYRISWAKWPISGGDGVKRSSGAADREDWSYCGNQWKDRSPCRWK